MGQTEMSPLPEKRGETTKEEVLNSFVRGLSTDPRLGDEMPAVKEGFSEVEQMLKGIEIKDGFDKDGAKSRLLLLGIQLKLAEQILNKEELQVLYRVLNEAIEYLARHEGDGGDLSSGTHFEAREALVEVPRIYFSNYFLAKLHTLGFDLTRPRDRENFIAYDKDSDKFSLNIHKAEPHFEGPPCLRLVATTYLQGNHKNE